MDTEDSSSLPWQKRLLYLKQQKVYVLVTEHSSNVRTCFTNCTQFMQQLAVKIHPGCTPLLNRSCVFSQIFKKAQFWQKLRIESPNFGPWIRAIWKVLSTFPRPKPAVPNSRNLEFVSTGKRIFGFCEVRTRFIYFTGTSGSVWPQTLAYRRFNIVAIERRNNFFDW